MTTLLKGEKICSAATATNDDLKKFKAASLKQLFYACPDECELIWMIQYFK